MSPGGVRLCSVCEECGGAVSCPVCVSRVLLRVRVCELCVCIRDTCSRPPLTLRLSHRAATQLKLHPDPRGSSGIPPTLPPGQRLCFGAQGLGYFN